MSNRFFEGDPIQLNDYFTQTDWNDVWQCIEVIEDELRGRYIKAKCVGFKEELDRPLKDTMYGIVTNCSGYYGHDLDRTDWPRVVTRSKWSPHYTYFPDPVNALVRRTEYDNNDSDRDVSSS